MQARWQRLAQLALENLPFPPYQARSVLSVHANREVALYLQHYLPYSQVLHRHPDDDRVLPATPLSGSPVPLAGFRGDCVVTIIEPEQPVELLLERAEQVNARWVLIVAPSAIVQSVDWQARGYQIHYETTEEPTDGVIVAALRDREAQHELLARPRVLICSPVRQKPTILRHFLEGLHRLDTTNLEVAFLFIDNNDDARATEMLREFASQVDAPVYRLRIPTTEPYHRTEIGHAWTESLCWRLAALKDGALQAALKHGYDYAFLVDSDLLLHPQTLRRLISLQRDIVSQVFWTVWQPGAPPLPNVWQGDFYNLHRVRRGQSLNSEEQRRRVEAFLSALAFHPGVYRVSGLGACTLISRRAIEAGVSFAEVRGCLLPGEDRHFCLRAEALGIRLFADSVFQPLHLYRESEVYRVDEYWWLVERGLQGAELSRQMFRLLLDERLSAA